MNKRFELTESETLNVCGGDIGVNHNVREVKNTSTGLYYKICDGVDSQELADWVFNTRTSFGATTADRDANQIAEMISKGWIVAK